MNTEASSPPVRFERRWPVATAIVVVIVLMWLLPRYISLLPTWVASIVGAAILAPVVIVDRTGASARWVRWERRVILFFFVYGVLSNLANLANLANLIRLMVLRATETSGLQLLMASIALWTTTVLMFSLLYWQLDRGGPEGRIKGPGAGPDWLFPQAGAPAGDVPAGWRPTYVDYLFIAYTTATAFSPTDTLPLKPRAKLLMMLESSISLLTVLVVAARAINILGG